MTSQSVVEYQILDCIFKDVYYFIIGSQIPIGPSEIQTLISRWKCIGGKGIMFSYLLRIKCIVVEIKTAKDLTDCALGLNEIFDDKILS